MEIVLSNNLQEEISSPNDEMKQNNNIQTKQKNFSSQTSSEEDLQNKDSPLKEKKDKKKATDKTIVKRTVIDNFNTGNQNFPENDINISEICDQLKQIPYAVLSNHGILQIAPDGNFVCPNKICRNGSGENGTGIQEHVEPNGVRTSHCMKCSKNFDNIKIFANYYGLDTQSDFIEIIRRGAREFLNIDTDFERNFNNADEVTLILKDIVESQQNLFNFLENNGGSWRGLLPDTLIHFRCGFLEKWTHPKNIVAGKNLYCSRRIIIQTGSQNYNAILLNEDRPKFPKKSWKLNAGNKKIFGLDLLPLNPELVILVEGEVDAASIWQATEGKVFVVAIGGISISKNCFADFLKFFSGVKKPRILIIPDNDVAGRDNAQKLRDKFVNNYFPAVFKFLVESKEKCDANDILQRQGNKKLGELIEKIIADSQADFERVEEQIAEDSQPVDVKTDFIMSDDLRRIIYFGGNTDLDNGRRLAALFCNEVKNVTDIEKWAFYNTETGIWEVQTSGKNCNALFLAEKAADIIFTNAKSDIEKKRAMPFRKHKYASPAIAYFKVSNAVKITSRQFDKNQMYLPVKNGVIDLTTGELLPYAPELYLTKQCPVEYRGLEYRSQLFDDFMKSILPDEQTRRAVLRFLGYCLTGNVTEEKALFIVGNGRNGKGTLIKILLTLFDALATSLKIESLLQQKYKDGNSATPEFAKLDGCRLAVANEIPQGEKLDVAKFKDLTGGDKFSARKLHSEPILIEPHFKLILCGQYLPEIYNANDVGYNERLIVVKFPQQFTGENCDPTLKQRLLATEVLSGVLSTFVAECLAWQKDGLIISDAMKEEKKNYFDSNNFIADFVSEYCIIKENATCKLKDLLKVLRSNYSDDIKGLSDRALSDMLRKELVKYKSVTYRKTGTYKFFGIGLLDEHQCKFDFEDIRSSAEEFTMKDFYNKAVSSDDNSTDDKKIS